MILDLLFRVLPQQGQSVHRPRTRRALLLADMVLAVAAALACWQVDAQRNEVQLARLRLAVPQLADLDADARADLVRIADSCALHATRADRAHVADCLLRGASALDRDDAPEMRWSALLARLGVERLPLPASDDAGDGAPGGGPAAPTASIADLDGYANLLAP